MKVRAVVEPEFDPYKVLRQPGGRSCAVTLKLGDQKVGTYTTLTETTVETLEAFFTALAKEAAAPKTLVPKSIEHNAAVRWTAAVAAMTGQSTVLAKAPTKPEPELLAKTLTKPEPELLAKTPTKPEPELLAKTPTKTRAKTPAPTKPLAPSTQPSPPRNLGLF